MSKKQEAEKRKTRFAHKRLQLQKKEADNSAVLNSDEDSSASAEATKKILKMPKPKINYEETASQKKKTLRKKKEKEWMGTLTLFRFCNFCVILIWKKIQNVKKNCFFLYSLFLLWHSVNRKYFFSRCPNSPEKILRGFFKLLKNEKAII